MFPQFSGANITKILKNKVRHLGDISKLRNAKFVVFRDPTHPVIKVMQNSNIFTDPLPRNE